MENKNIEMPEIQKRQILEMDSEALMNFQIRLQIECGMTDKEACDYIAQAYGDNDVN